MQRAHPSYAARNRIFNQEAGVNNKAIDYIHAENVHGIEGPKTALPLLLQGRPIHSLLDVGCGTGTWLKAALDMGVQRAMGVDGVAVKDDELLVPRRLIRQINFESPFDLEEKFDAVLCLEVAEHLPPSAAEDFVRSMCRHGDFILFSAACPGQAGQHHVNCQWPDYWQKLFNENGFVCSDAPRWQIWSVAEIEPWYRQNIFTATYDANLAGREKRICKVIHPDLFEALSQTHASKQNAFFERAVSGGYFPLEFYIRSIRKNMRCIFIKIARFINLRKYSLE